MTLDTVRTGVHTQMVSFLREPLNLALMVIIPPLIVLGFGEAMASIPKTPTMQAVPETIGKVLGAMFSTAFLSGILGLFQSINSQEADRRLALTGYPVATLLTARLVTITALIVAIAAVTYGVLLITITPEAPFLAFGVLVLGGGVYALLGVLIGALIPRTFEGSLVLVGMANMDAFLGSGMSTVETDIPKLFPLYYPNKLLNDAVIEGSVANGDLLAVGIYVTVLLMAVFGFFTRIVETEGIA